MASKKFDLITNYVYIYQLNKYVIIPTYPENISDRLGSTFASTNILSRTAPIYSYSYSGPRTIQFDINLHRDLMTQLNYDNIDFLDDLGLNDDYIDTLIRYLQAMALPTYKVNEVLSSINQGTIVNPPVVAVRFGQSVFIKGIVNGDVAVNYQGPIDRDGKYQQVSLSFAVTETEPQDAESIAQNGSFRGLNLVLARGLGLRK